MSLHFTIVVPKVRTAAPDEMLFTTVGNHSAFPTGARFLADSSVEPTRVVSQSRFPSHTRLAEGVADVNLSLTRLGNTSVLGANELDEAPADVELLLTRVANTSALGANELDEAPPDEALRFTRLGSTTSFGGMVLVPEESDGDTADEDATEGIASGVVGSMI